MSRIVAIDYGHGGLDPGCVASDGTKESDLAADIGELVIHTINNSKFGIEARQVHRRDEDPGLSARAFIARDLGADLAVSIHCNSGEAYANGAFVFAVSGDSSSGSIGDVISLAMPPELMRHRRCVFVDTSTSTAGETHYPNERLWPRVANCLRPYPDTMDKVLVECCFLSHEKDLENIKKKDVQAGIAAAIICGILSKR